MAASASFCSWTFVLVCILPVGPIRSSPTRIVTSSQTPSSSAVVAGAADEGGAGAAVNSNLVSEYPQSAPYEGPAEAIRKMREMLGRVETEDSRGLKRVFLSKDNVTCNDGSPAGFYIRKSPSSKKWIIFLEGGWYCYDQRSCQNRWLRLRNFMTSKQWAETRNVGGILSQNPEENPYWWNANHIFVPYCSSDSWSGTRPQPHRWHHHPEGTVKYAFMGSYIVQEVIKDLLPLGLAQATTLILAGSSAGGTGVIVNLDRVADNLAELGHGNIDVRGLADSGWFLDNAPYSSISSPPSSTFASSWLVTSPAQAVKKGVELWRGNVPDRCRQDYPDEIWRCYFGYRVYPTLKAPLFVFQWLFDEAQMTADNVGAPVTKEQWDYIHRTGDTLRKTFENVTGLFAASCISHTVLTKRDWQTIRLGDATLPQTLHCWEMHLLRLRKGKDPRDSHHPGHYGVSSHHHKHQHHRQHHNGHVSYMQAPPQKEGRPGKTMNDKTADFPQAMQTKGKNVTVELIWRQDPREPLLSYTGNKEVTVSTWDPLSFTTGSENTTMLGDAPISSTMRYMKNAKSANKAQVSTTSTSLAPSYPVISTPASVLFNSRPFSRKQRGGKESELAERELSGVKGGRENKGEERKHRRKEKRKRRRRRRRRKKKKTEEGGEDEEEKAEEGSREAEGGAKHRKGGRANRRGEGQRGRRRNGGRASGRVRRSEFPSGRVQWLKEEDGNESSMRESDARGQRGRGGGNHCSHRLMERCTWPQCNHSCPKLHNPFTGEEMDFIELLKSFGLDMMSVANALGIDIHTLNNMDHDELLNLLTQQSN